MFPKKVVLLLLFFSVVSCSLPKYTLQNKFNATNLNYDSGTWLLNTLDVPYNIINKVETDLINEFKNNANERFTYYPNSSGIMISKDVPLNPSKTKLKELKLLSGFDYFINVKGDILKDDLGSINTTKIGSYRESNLTFVALEIYDLNEETIIYSQKVTGYVTRTEDNDDIHFTKTSKELLLKSFSKLLDDLKLKKVTP